MDGGPFRGSRPTDRTVVSRGDTVRRQSIEPQPSPKAEPAAVPRTSSPHRIPEDKKTFKRFILPIIILIVAIAVVAGGWFAYSKMQSTSTAIDSSKYQAVFFTNGQVYFGKLETFNGEYMKLKDIYYLQTQANADGQESKNPQEASTDQSNVQLIKLGDEVHGPEDQMVIAKNQMLFFENLKSDGKVAKSIDNFKNPN